MKKALIIAAVVVMTATFSNISAPVETKAATSVSSNTSNTATDLSFPDFKAVDDSEKLELAKTVINTMVKVDSVEMKDNFDGFTIYAKNGLHFYTEYPGQNGKETIIIPGDGYKYQGAQGQWIKQRMSSIQTAYGELIPNENVLNTLLIAFKAYKNPEGKILFKGENLNGNFTSLIFNGVENPNPSPVLSDYYFIINADCTLEKLIISTKAQGIENTLRIFEMSNYNKAKEIVLPEEAKNAIEQP